MKTKSLSSIKDDIELNLVKLRDPDWKVRVSSTQYFLDTADSLPKSKIASVIDGLLNISDDPFSQVTARSTKSLGILISRLSAPKRRSLIEMLIRDLSNENWNVRSFCALSLDSASNSINSLPASRIIEVVDTLLNQLDRSFSGTSIGCFVPFLPESKITSVVETLISTLRNKNRPKNDDGRVEEDNWFARVEAANGLGAILSYIPESQKILVCREILNGLNDSDDSVKEACSDVFESIMYFVAPVSQEHIFRFLELMTEVQKSCQTTAVNILSRSAIFKNEKNIK